MTARHIWLLDVITVGENPHRIIMPDFSIFFPQVSVRNVYIFPGIPSLMERAFKGLEHLFAGSGTTFHSREVTTSTYVVEKSSWRLLIQGSCCCQVFVDADETEIAPVLTNLQSRWGRKVALGSYPDWLSNYHRVRLVLDSDSQEQLEEARAQLLEELPKGSVVSLVTDPVSIATAEVYALANNGTGEGQRVMEDKLSNWYGGNAAWNVPLQAINIRNHQIITGCCGTGCKQAATPPYVASPEPRLRLHFLFQQDSTLTLIFLVVFLGAWQKVEL